MSDKQRADHVQAKYWNGFLTRVEAQKVFGEYASALNKQAQVMQKMDAVLSFIAEKFGITTTEIEAWITKKIVAEDVQAATEPEKVNAA